MFRDHLASQTDMRLEHMDNGSTELKWCIFTKGIRPPVAKIIVDTRQHKLVAPGQDHEPTAHIVNVFVRPEHRGKKLGEHLVRLAQTAMRENGFVWMTLEAEEKVEHHGRLVALYERCGFSVHPPDIKIPLEYNGDECYRKVPMRCNLLRLRFDDEENMSVQPQDGSSASSSSSSGSASVSSALNRFASSSFVEEMKREVLHLLQMGSLNVDILTAIEYVDQHIASGTMESAFRTGLHIRSLGHPDWMELAGYLRHVGRIQEKWTEWHSPYMVRIEGDRQPQQSRRSVTESDAEEGDEDGEGEMPIKTGPLPRELCDDRQSRVFIDPERYTQEGVDEAMLTWTPSEYAFLALTFGDRCSAPGEMAQVLRYAECPAWLETQDYAYLESYGDADLKRLVVQFKSCLDESDRRQGGEMSGNKMEEARARLAELVDKYCSDVKML